MAAAEQISANKQHGGELGLPELPRVCGAHASPRRSHCAVPGGVCRLFFALISPARHNATAPITPFRPQQKAGTAATSTPAPCSAAT